MDCLRNRVVSDQSSARDVVLTFDRVSELVCRVVDASEVCRMASPDRFYVQNALEGGNIGRAYFHELNSDPLYYLMLLYGRAGPQPDAPQQRQRHDQWWASLTEPERRVAQLFRHDFEMGGIHLPADKRRSLLQLLSRCDELSFQIYKVLEPSVDPTDGSNNSQQPKLTVDVETARQCFGHDNAFLPADSSARSGPARVVCLPLAYNSPLVDTIVQHSQSWETRRNAYLHRHSDPQGHRHAFERLAGARHQLAQLCGHKSYAEMTLHDKMARTPDRVQLFLDSLVDRLKDRAAGEVAQLQQTLDESQATTGGQGGGRVAVHDWDIPFCRSLLIKNLQQKSSSEGADLLGTGDGGPRRYFTVRNCLLGLNLVSERLFGMSLVPLAGPGPIGVAAAGNFTATTTATATDDRWHPSVIKCGLVQRDTGNLLGFIYFDLMKRAPKTGEAACFPIQFGKLAPSTGGGDPVSVGSVAMVTAFRDLDPKSRGVAEIDFDRDDGGPLLAHSDCVTLFHEYGHAVHMLVGCRTEFQHVAGTRGPPDFVELPSTLMERFAWDERVVPLFAIDQACDQAISVNEIRQLVADRKVTPALDTLHGVLLSQFDQALHGPNPPVTPDSSSSLAAAQWDSVYKGVLPPLPWNSGDGIHWFTQFTHVASYGANYYSYLWSRALAVEVWQQLFENDPLNRQAGQLLLDKLLCWGNSRPPDDLLSDLLGASVYDGNAPPTPTDVNSFLKF